MIIITIFSIAGVAFALITDLYFLKKYGYPSLSIFSAKCYKSKYFKWLVFNIVGNSDWYFERVLTAIKKEKIDG